MVVFGLFQLLLSQLPSLHNIAWLSVVAVATSLGYSFISLGLCAAKWASHGHVRGTLAGAAVPADLGRLRCPHVPHLRRCPVPPPTSLAGAPLRR